MNSKAKLATLESNDKNTKTSSSFIMVEIGALVNISLSVF
jgi:hypothetical protein